MHEKTQVLKTAKIDFHGQILLTAKIDNRIFVAMKPIVEGMGLDWSTQRRKILESKRSHMTRGISTPNGMQQMVCLPIKELNAWLLSMNSR